MRYDQESAVMRTMQPEMRMRSRCESAATADGLCTSPGKRRVLSVVLAARVVPRQTERAYVTFHRMSEREAIRSRMARVVEIERLGRVGVDPHRPFSSHVEQARRLDGPFHAIPIKPDGRRFHAQELAYQ